MTLPSSPAAGLPLTDKLRQHAARDPLQIGPAARPVIRVVPLEFRGKAGEYFRIWLVNVALSIITLGLYLPWARVRMRRYFYGQTYLEGHNFQYSASPVSLLAGYLLVGALFITFTFTQNFDGWKWLSYLLIAAFYLLYPWLLYRSLRFQAHNTLHRGLRFGFGSSVGQSYLLYGLLPLTYWFTMGLTIPLAQFLQRRFVAQGLRYGGAAGSFRGSAGPVYLTYLAAAGGALAVGLLVVALLVGLQALHLERSQGWQQAWPYLAVSLLGALGYLGMGQFVKAQLLRYTLEQAQLGATLRFRVRYRPLGLTWILLSNLLAQFLTLGLATPWAAVRKSRYLLSHIDILTLAPLDQYQAGGNLHEAALGEAAAELFDIGVSL